MFAENVEQSVVLVIRGTTIVTNCLAHDLMWKQGSPIGQFVFSAVVQELIDVSMPRQIDI